MPPERGATPVPSDLVVTSAAAAAGTCASGIENSPTPTAAERAAARGPHGNDGGFTAPSARPRGPPGLVSFRAAAVKREVCAALVAEVEGFAALGRDVLHVLWFRGGEKRWSVGGIVGGSRGGVHAVGGKSRTTEVGTSRGVFAGDGSGGWSYGSRPNVARAQLLLFRLKPLEYPTHTNRDAIVDVRTRALYQQGNELWAAQEKRFMRGTQALYAASFTPFGTDEEKRQERGQTHQPPHDDSN